MNTKALAFEVKAFDAESGVFEGYASVFGVKDSYGDVVVKGAFAESLSNDYAGGAGIPCWWSHKFDDPEMNIGKTLSAVEDDHGLLVKVQLDLASSTGSRVHALMLDGRVSQMSFGYKVLEGAFVESDEHGYFYEIRKVKLYEVSVTPIGANDATEILSVKADLAPGISEALHAAHAALAHAYKAAGLSMPGGDSSAPEGPPAADAAASPDTPAAPVAGSTDSESKADDEPDAAKDDEPGGTPAAKSDEPAAAKSATAVHESTIARAAAALQLAGNL